MNYPAKARGVARLDHPLAALAKCPELIIVHVETLPCDDGAVECTEDYGCGAGGGAEAAPAKNVPHPALVPLPLGPDTHPITVEALAEAETEAYKKVRPT